MVPKGIPAILLWKLHQPGAQGIESYIGQAVAQGHSDFNDHTVISIAPKVTPPVVTPVVKPGKVNLYFTHKLRKI